MKSTRNLFTLVPFHALLALGAVVLAGFAQFAHTFKQADGAALACFAAGLALWAIALVRGELELDPAEGPADRATLAPRRGTRLLASGAFALAVVTFLGSNDDAFTLDNVAAWVLSIAVFLYAFWEPEKGWEELRTALAGRGAQLWQGAANGLQISGRAIALALIILLGAFFYLNNLQGVPAEMDSDHAEVILDVNDVLTQGDRPIFFEREGGREPLETYLVAALAGLEGQPPDHTTLKWVTALAGLLLIPATFLLSREWLAGDVALLAAALVAISKWPVTLARMGLPYVFAPLFVALTLYFLVRGCKYGRRNDFLVAGLALGAGVYGYSAFWVVPLLVVLWVLVWPVVIRKRTIAEDSAGMRGIGTRYGQNVFLMLALAVVVWMPLLRYAYDHPDKYWPRVLPVASLAPPEMGRLAVLRSNAVNTALMFNWTSDPAWPNAIPGDPALDYVSGGLFLLGLAYALSRIVRHRVWPYAFLLIGLAFLLLPTVLTLSWPNDNPSFTRAGGAIPLVLIVAALPLAWLVRTLRGALGEDSARPALAVGVAALVLAAIAGVNGVRYFRDFDANYREKSWNSSEVAEVIRGFGESVGDYSHTYIMLYPHWIDTRNVAINLGNIGWNQTLADVQAASLHVVDANNKLFVLHLDDREHLAKLQELMPNGQLRLFRSRTPGHDFILWYVPGTIAPTVPAPGQ